MEQNAMTLSPEIQALIDQAKANDQELLGASKVLFVSLAAKLSQAVDPDNTEAYIPGLTAGMWYCHTMKINFGTNPKVIPLTIIPAYNLYESMDKKAKFIKTVSDADGKKFPLLQFTFPSGKPNWSIRDAGNGQILKPSAWIPVMLVDFPEFPTKEQAPECKAVVLTFKDTSMPCVAALKKDLKNRVSPMCFNVYQLGSHVETMKDDKTVTYRVPDMTWVSSVTDPAFAEKVLKASLAINAEAQKNQLFIPYTPEQAGMVVSAPVQTKAVAFNAAAALSDKALAGPLEDEETIPF